MNWRTVSGPAKSGSAARRYVASDASGSSKPGRTSLVALSSLAIALGSASREMRTALGHERRDALGEVLARDAFALQPGLVAQRAHEVHRRGAAQGRLRRRDRARRPLG